jgi:hypothetical protein
MFPQRPVRLTSYFRKFTLSVIDRWPGGIRQKLHLRSSSLGEEDCGCGAVGDNQSGTVRRSRLVRWLA